MSYLSAILLLHSRNSMVYCQEVNTTSPDATETLPTPIPIPEIPVTPPPDAVPVKLTRAQLEQEHEALQKAYKKALDVNFEALAKNSQLRQAFGALVAKIDVCRNSPQWIDVFAMYAKNVKAYDGPKFGAELTAAKAALDTK